MHMLLTIYDLKPLTDAQLAVLDRRLRHILASTTLTETDRANIFASLDAISPEQSLRVCQSNTNML